MADVAKTLLEEFEGDYPGHKAPEPIRSLVKDAFMAGAAVMFIQLSREGRTEESVIAELLAYSPPEDALMQVLNMKVGRA